MITRILSVPQWRERYLEVYRQIVEEQLAQERFARRDEAYRTLLEDSIAKDPMGPSPEAFQSSAIEGEQSLGAIVERRRSFLLKHESLQTHQNEENQDE